MKRILFALLYILIILVLYVQLPQTTSFVSDEGFVELFFCQEVNCSQLLVDLLTTTNTASCALYDIDDMTIISTMQLENTSTLLYKENYETSFGDVFEPVTSKGLMHHKFCVFDNKYVLTGSWNPTYRGSNYNDNYVLFFSSKKIAKNFLEAYDYVATKKREPSLLQVNLSGTPLSIYYCPFHHCEERVLEAIKQAKHSIQVLAFSFTSQPIAEALVNASTQGVQVRVIFEKTRIASYSQHDYLLKHNISVFKDGNAYTMHEKLFIIDNTTIIAGSYNPTKAATTRNDENLLVIQSPLLVNQSLREFERILTDVN